MTGITALQRKLINYLSSPELAEIESAYQYSESAHGGQLRASGKPYIQHPLTVADILADWRFDAQSIIAALLHDVVEDTSVSLAQVREKFGPAIAKLVDGLSKIDRIEGIDRREQEAENFRKILLAAADDWRVLFIKLADRLHNMRTLAAISSRERRRRIAQETLDIYAPIAERLNFSPVRDELQNLSFRYLHPYRYRVLSKARNNPKAGRHAFNRVENMIHQSIHKHGIAGELRKRRKNLYSIHKKMEDQKISFAEVEDIIGFRLIVQNRMDCYRALGALHECGVPVPNRFSDYIAMPKANGYQSLHTALNIENVKAEVQIRTRNMDEIAEHGLAAHWQYKNPDAVSDAAQNEALNHLSSLVRLHAENAVPGDFMEYLRLELSAGEIYVLTPEGKVVRMPPQSTALDFAYAIHTGVGDTAESAFINGVALPLSWRLRSGDQISIKTNPDSRPLPHWLNIAKTARARSRIRHVLNAVNRDDSISLGRQLLRSALQKMKDAPDLDGIDDNHRRAFLAANNMQTVEELYLEIGLGRMLSDIVARGLLRRQAGQTSHALQPVPIAGARGAAITLSSCCYPLPFEPIVGILQKSRGLIVHADQCPAVKSPSRRSPKWIDTAWSEKSTSTVHRSAIVLHCSNKTGLASAVSSTISTQDINIVTFNFNSGELSRAYIHMEIIVEVKSLAELNRLLETLRNMPEVIDARRRSGLPPSAETHD